MKHMKISGFVDEISSDFNHQLGTAKRLGLEYIEVRGIDGQFIGLHPPAAIQEFAQRIHSCGLSVSCLASPTGKIFINDPFEPHLEQFKHTLETAALLHTKYIRVFSFFMPKGENPDTYHDLVVERLAKIIELTRQADMVLLHENEKDIYGDTVARCCKLIEALNSPHFMAAFDFANFVQCKQNVLDAYQTMKPYIGYFHIKDEIATTGESVPAGKGDGKIREILAQAVQSGYNGFLSLEPHLVDFNGLNSLEIAPKARNSHLSGEEAFTLAKTALDTILQTL